MPSKYPSPCLKCSRSKECVGYSCRGGKQYWCARYATWFKWWWKRFRYVFKNPQEIRKPNANKFCYSHPDHVKKYLQEGPCAGCYAQEDCDTPCKAYLRWYDARMEIVKKKIRKD